MYLGKDAYAPARIILYLGAKGPRWAFPKSIWILEYFKDVLVIMYAENILGMQSYGIVYTYRYLIYLGTRINSASYKKGY